MPELPEVTTIVRNLKDKILNKKIEQFSLIYPKELLNSNKDDVISLITSRKFTDVSNVGKLIILTLDDLSHMFIHLRMEGKLFYFVDKSQKNSQEADYYLRLKNNDIFNINFDDGSILIFNDTRKFGIVKYLDKDISDISTEKLFPKGLDVFNINQAKKKEIFDTILKSNKMIKELITDQNLILGIGNIYADEILFKSKISPFCLGKNLKENDLDLILNNSKEILKIAIDNKGSTISSYHPDFSSSGGFQNFLKVYSRYKEKCVICGTTIERRKINGRSTCFCPKCQNVAKSISITGPIASGKTTLLKIIEKQINGKIFSLDDYVHFLYHTKSFLSFINSNFKELLFNDKIVERINNPVNKIEDLSKLNIKENPFVFTESLDVYSQLVGQINIGFIFPRFKNIENEFNSFYDVYLKNIKHIDNKNYIFNSNILVDKFKNEKDYKSKFQTVFYPYLKEKINDVLNCFYKETFVVEIPLLFDSNMQELFSYNIGIESFNSLNFLTDREKSLNEVKFKTKLSESNSYYKNKNKLDYIFLNDSSKEDLQEKVKEYLDHLDIK